MHELQQEMPFYESAEDATYSAILDSKKPVKEVAHALWPSMKMDSAYSRLKGALKEDRKEKLSSDEHLFIANYCQKFHWHYYNENQLHHAGSQLVKQEDELAKLEHQILKGQQALTQALNRFNALRGGAK